MLKLFRKFSSKFVNFRQRFGIIDPLVPKDMFRLVFLSSVFLLHAKGGALQQIRVCKGGGELYSLPVIIRFFWSACTFASTSRPDKTEVATRDVLCMYVCVCMCVYVCMYLYIHMSACSYLYNTSSGGPSGHAYHWHYGRWVMRLIDEHLPRLFFGSHASFQSIMHHPRSGPLLRFTCARIVPDMAWGGESSLEHRASIPYCHHLLIH